MHVPNNALVLIADGEKALFLRNEGDEKYLNLQVERKQEQDNPPNREQAANRPGRMFDNGDHRSAVDDTDWHELAKDRFAADLSDRLYKRAYNKDFSDLIIVATPNTLGELRQHLHVEVLDRLCGEVDKDWTNHPLNEIESLLQKQKARPLD
jgi:protein required for attachment to host cells